MVPGVTGRRPSPRLERGRALSVRTQVTLDAVVGLAARFALALSTSYRTVDADTFAAWARTMHDHPLRDFYATAPVPDHLPGDLWLLKGLQLGYSAAGGRAYESHTFELLTNAVPIVVDVVVGLLLFKIVQLNGSVESAARAARWYLLNPAVIVLAGVWGQWDSVSMSVLLLALLLVLRAGWSWIWAAPVLAWAVLIKPQLAVPVVILAVWVVLRPDSPARGERRQSGRLALAGGASLLGAVLMALCLLEPFRVGLAWTPHGGSSLADRVRYAADLHPFTTMGAANLWMVVNRSVIGPSDDVRHWGSLTAAAIGIYLLLVLWCVVAVTARSAFPPPRRLESLLWASVTATCASCVVLTRVHERYYFPVLVLMLVWTASRGFDRRAIVLFWCISSLFVIDLVIPMGWTGQDEQFTTRGCPGSSSADDTRCPRAPAHRVLLRARGAPVGRVRVDAPSGATVSHRTAPG